MALLGPASDLRPRLGEKLEQAAVAGSTVYLPFVCLGEFWRTLTEPRGYAVAPESVYLLLKRALRLMPPLMPPPTFTDTWLALADRLRPTGAAVFDVQIAALCLHHRVDDLWTFDQGFPSVDGLRVVNPLAG